MRLALLLAAAVCIGVQLTCFIVDERKGHDRWFNAGIVFMLVGVAFAQASKLVGP